VPRSAIEALEQHPWPGNIRELRNVIERAVILSSANALVLPNLGEAVESAAQPTSLEEVERQHILKVLEKTGWRVKGPYGAARLLEVNPSTLYSRMEKLGIHRKEPATALPVAA
jgi:transcriptional regulator of acetoin/glycerol metabolism